MAAAGSSPLRFRARRPGKATATGPRLGRAEGEGKQAAGDTRCTSFSSLQLMSPLPVPQPGDAACGAQGQGVSSCSAGLLAGEQPQHTGPFLLLRGDGKVP